MNLLKKYSLSGILFFLYQCLITAQTIVTIPAGNPSGTGATNNVHRKPLGAYFGYERCALIYTAQEVGTGGTITALAFYCDTLNSGVSPNIPVKIYMKETTDTVFAQSTTVIAEQNNSTLVYSGSLNAASFSQGNFVQLTLNQPFVHNAANNIEIITETNVGGTGNEAILGKGFRYLHDSSHYRMQYWQQDNNAPSGAGTLEHKRPNVQLSIQALANCLTPPTPGLAVASDSSLCEGAVFSITLNGYSGGSGQTYQWQKSTNGINWMDISGATSPYYSSIMDSTRYYRCSLTCNANTAISSNVKINKNPVTQCYCSSSLAGNCNNEYYIDSVNITGTSLNNPHTGCGNLSALYYSAYPANGNTTCTLKADSTYTLNLRLNGSNIVSMWIDYNQDGVFGQKEWIQVCTSSPTNTTVAVNFTVPDTARNGTTGMRIRSRAADNINDSTSACTGFGTGETEDYQITITGSTFGIKKSDADQFINIFPNPCQEQLYIIANGLSGRVQMQVYNNIGALVQEQYFSSWRAGERKAIEMSQMPAGMYFLILKTEERQYNARIIRE